MFAHLAKGWSVDFESCITKRFRPVETETELSSSFSWNASDSELFETHNCNTKTGRANPVAPSISAPSFDIPSGVDLAANFRQTKHISFESQANAKLLPSFQVRCLIQFKTKPKFHLKSMVKIRNKGISGVMWKYFKEASDKACGWQIQSKSYCGQNIKGPNPPEDFWSSLSQLNRLSVHFYIVCFDFWTFVNRLWGPNNNCSGSGFTLDVFSRGDSFSDVMMSHDVFMSSFIVLLWSFPDPRVARSKQAVHLLDLHWWSMCYLAELQAILGFTISSGFVETRKLH